MAVAVALCWWRLSTGYCSIQPSALPCAGCSEPAHTRHAADILLTVPMLKTLQMQTILQVIVSSSTTFYHCINHQEEQAMAQWVGGEDSATCVI